jgi:ABC-type cobalamin/Fe3+-siderophores transport system ATPase subunit
VTERWSAASESRAPTLELREARLRATDAPLSLCSSARRIALLGDWQPLFGALTGAATPAAGSAQILGCELREAVACGIAGVALCDPPLPAAFSVREYLEHAARLSHGSARRAEGDARLSLDQLGLTELAALPIGRLAPYQRRALGIALATLGAPAVICLESPLAGLDAASADYVAKLCARAIERQRLIVSGAAPNTPSPERAFLDTCEELFLLRSGVLVASGPPETVFSAHARYLLTLTGDGARLANALDEAGCKLQLQPSPSYGALLGPGARVSRYLVELPPSTSSDLVLDSALALGVSVLELEPLQGD